MSCKAAHLAGAAFLYRSVEAWIDPVNYEHMPVPSFTDNRPIRFLDTIIRSTLASPNLCLPSRCYASHLITLCYGSWSMGCDFRGLPLLAEVLCFTHRLRHLRLDVPGETVPMLLDILRHSSIIITPSTMLPGSSRFDSRPLPYLESIRTLRITIADALMQYRAIQTIAVDLSIKWEVLSKFLRAEAPWNPTHLQCLSLYVAGYPPPHGVLEGMLVTFPRLRHLAIRVQAQRAAEFVEDALRSLIDLPDIGRSLHTLSINHGSYYPNYGPVLEDVGHFFAEEYYKKTALREVVMGGSMWKRKTMLDTWRFEYFERSHLEHWPWLLHRSEGEWARFGRAVKACYRFKD